jgi:radical SAM family uncharacterized protein
MIDTFLSQVQKPGRYLGKEWNVPQKDFLAAAVRVALCFPDLYEIGMSNLGIRILYGIINGLADASCERFFSYAGDAKAVLTGLGMEPFSLETQTPLRAFDIAGFSIGSELDYTNILTMLSLAGIPLDAAARTAAHPLVIGGGPCTVNPEPLHSFFDLFVIGEAEEAIQEILLMYAKHKKAYRAGQMSRHEMLMQLASIEGVYVPSFYEVMYSPEGRVVSFASKYPQVPSRVRKRIVRNFDSAFFPDAWIVPYIQVVHDRISLELMRGCPNRCRFCQSRSQYYPFRVRAAQNAFDLAVSACKKSGYEELALTGLSVSDYPYLGELVPQLVNYFKQDAVALSLPSLKAKDILGDVFAVIARIKKTGLTFAPEAGSARLRDALAKDFDEDVFRAGLERAYGCGYQHVKLYFMIGLPGETDEDLTGIADFSLQASQLRRKMGLPPAQVNISVNTFIPKPHTAFQWCGMSSREELWRKQQLLKDAVRKKSVRVSFHGIGMSIIEGIFSRGDRRLDRVITRAFEKGACFDAWDDHFSYDRWMEAFKEEGIDPLFYLKPRATDEILPWDFLDICGDKEGLLAEYNKAKELTETVAGGE